MNMTILIQPTEIIRRLQAPGQPLFIFNGSEPAWQTVNDTVMGGLSFSSVRLDPQAHTLTFSGTVSLDNNGGFASIRSTWAVYDLRGFDGILMRVLGDGKTYNLRLRTAVTGSDIAYTAPFSTRKDDWHDVFIAFAALVPTYRGRSLPHVGAIDPAAIRSLGLMIANKQEGPFSLTIDWISAVSVQRHAHSFLGGPDQVPSLVYIHD